MSKRIRAILLSCITVLCSLGLIVGGTFALFEQTQLVSNHLQAGSMNVELYRVNLHSKVMDENGNDKEIINPERVDFTNELAENIFGLEGTAKVVPGCYFAATMEIVNSGGDVAFNYFVEIRLSGGAANELASQLRLVVEVDGQEPRSALLSELTDGMQLGSAEDPIGQILLNQSAQFVVRLEFVDVPDNNSAQEQTVSFDLIVHAVQATEALG